MFKNIFIGGMLGILMLAGTAVYSAEPGKHLFILGGQSNMAGLDPNQAFTPAVSKAFGTGNVIVVKSANSGCPIRVWYRDWKPAKDWKPEKPGEEKWVENKVDYWGPVLMKAVKAAIAGEKLQTVTFIWMQGESDAMQRHSAVYGESLRGLVRQLEQDLGRTDINVVIGRISDFGVVRKWPHWLKVRQAQVEFAESSPRYAWVDTDDLNDGLNAKGIEIRNDLHYSVAGYKLLGERFAEKAIALVKAAACKSSVRSEK
ncbi:MAG: sialate O-acetylesterase [bacterium]